MKVTEFSVRNPLVVLAVTVTIGLFGTLSYASLGVAITPNVNFPGVVVVTVYPGADPETVESNVTRPIEDAIATLQNIDTNGLTSTSGQGVSIVTVQFTSAANADLVSVEVERVVNSVRSRLPPDVEAPSVTKIDINAQGVATVVFSGQQPLTVLQDVAENVIQREFNAIPGVGSTDIRSGITREIQVLVDEASLRALGLSITNVINAVQTQQLEVPARSITQDGRDYSVYFDSLVSSPQELQNLIVRQSPDGAVYLRDVARIEDTYRKRNAIVRVNGQEGLALAVVKLPSANTLSVVDGVKETIARLQPRLPANTRLDVVVDASTYTARSYNTVRNALVEAGPTRLRPIVMTTMSVMAALLPIASGLEEGSELLKSAAVVLIGGLITSTLLTLVFVPAMYTVFDDLQHAVTRRFRRTGAPACSTPAPPPAEARPAALPTAAGRG